MDPKKINFKVFGAIAAVLFVGIVFVLVGLRPAKQTATDQTNNNSGIFGEPTANPSDSTSQPDTNTSIVSSKIAGAVTAASMHAECEGKGEFGATFNCYKQELQAYMQANIKSDGGKKTMLLLDEMQKLGGFAQTECHPLAHKVGNIAFHVYGSVLKAVPQYVPVCASGFYHGLLEEYLATTPDYYDGILNVCGTVTGSGDPGYFNWFQCTHGLGHGIMEHDADEVPRSLKDCDTLPTMNQAQEICYAGVFMENITTDAKTGRASKYIKPENPIYPCDFVETKYKSACYFLSSSQILKINGWNFADGFKTCDTKAEKDYRWLCYESMGRDVSGSSFGNNARVNDLCMQGAEDMRGECFFGAVRDYINNNKTFDTAIVLCNSVAEDYRQKCYAGILLDLGLYKKGQDYLNTCATMPDPYKQQCNQLVQY